MNARDSLRSRPWRWIAVTVIALTLIVLIAAVLFVRSLLQPQRFTALLQSQLANVGLTLSVEKPAAPALWPHPAVQLQGFRLSSIGAGTPLLTATEARIVVPWRALLHRELAIQRLEIESPRIDLDQLQALLARLPRTQSEGAPQLPRIGAGLRIVDGTLVRNDEPLLFDLDAETGTLLPDVPFHLTASAHTGADRSGSLRLTALPHHRDDVLLFDQIHLNIAIQNGPRSELAGGARWHGGNEIAADFRGTLTLPASTVANASSVAPGASTATAHSAPRDYTLALHIQPGHGTAPLAAELKLDGANEHLDARVAPLQLMDWWNGVLTAAPGAPLTLPPMQGRAQVDEVIYGPLRMQGVKIEAGPNVAPLSAGSAPAPASARTKKGVVH